MKRLPIKYVSKIAEEPGSQFTRATISAGLGFTSDKELCQWIFFNVYLNVFSFDDFHTFALHFLHFFCIVSNFFSQSGQEYTNCPGKCLFSTCFLMFHFFAPIFPQILHLNLPTCTPPPTFEMYLLKSRKFVIPWSTSPGPSHWRRSWAGSSGSPGNMLASDLFFTCKASSSWGWTTNSCSSLICGTSPLLLFCALCSTFLSWTHGPVWERTAVLPILLTGRQSVLREKRKAQNSKQSHMTTYQVKFLK